MFKKINAFSLRIAACAESSFVSVGGSVRKAFELERPRTFQDWFVFRTIDRDPSILTLERLNFKLHGVEILRSVWPIHCLLKRWHVGIVLVHLGCVHTRIDDVHVAGIRTGKELCHICKHSIMTIRLTEEMCC